MKLQGRVPRSAKNVAEDIQINTRWPKYLVYDMILEIAVRFPINGIDVLEFDDQDGDNHSITADFFNSKDARQFCALYKAKTNAGFFRYALYHGAQIMHLYKEKKLPPEIAYDDVLAVVDNIVGNREKYKPGRDWISSLKP